MNNILDELEKELFCWERSRRKPYNKEEKETFFRRRLSEETEYTTEEIETIIFNIL